MRSIYVNRDSGSDSNDGITLPVLTVAKGVSLLRTGFNDHLLFRRGNNWGDQTLTLSKSGQDPANKLLIGYYGDSGPRPILGGINSIGGRNFIAITGLAGHPAARTGTDPAINPLGITARVGRSWLISDCILDEFATDLDLGQSGGTLASDVTIRRNIITGAYGLPRLNGAMVHSQGIYCSGINGLLLEDNVVDLCGWKSGVSRPEKFNHGFYILFTCQNAEVRSNLVSRCSSHGIQLRCGGRIIGNMIYRCPFQLFAGGAHGAFTGRSLVQGNVSLDPAILLAPANAGEAASGNYTVPTGGGFSAINSNGCDFVDNCLADSRTTITPAAFSAGGEDGGSHNCNLLGNHCWGYSVLAYADNGSDMPTDDGGNQLIPRTDLTTFPNPLITPHQLSGDASYDALIARHVARTVGTWDDSIAPSSLVAAARLLGFGL